MRKNKIDRDEGRDISEKIALGMLKGTGGKLTGESLYDSRLFNQSSGMDAGFGNEDEYNTYSKPLFDRDGGNNKNGNTSIYHPKKNDDDIYGDADKQLHDLTNTSRFRADKGFKGTSTASNEKRDGPVQFEKASSSSSSKQQSKHYDRDDDRRQGRQHDDDNDRYDNRTSSSRGGGGGNKQRGRDDDDRDDPFGINDIIDHKKSRRD